MEIRKKLETIKNQEWFNYFKNIYIRLSANRWVGFIAFLYVICFLMFFVTLVRNSFTIPISGDFTLQEIPFYFNGYDDWWTAITTGEFVLWDDSGMLGVNNIGANSFYYLFNPFFLVLLFVPRNFMMQAQAFMMITKMVLAGVSMKMLLEEFKVKEETTWLIGVAYAFCGWNLYYLWFNHFLEITVLMPLVLLGIEKIIRHQKPMFLIFTLFVSGLTNYFFLIAFCFTGAIYAVFRYFQNLKQYNQIAYQEKYGQGNLRNKKYSRMIDIRLEVILLGFFAFATGLMLASIILFPCFSVALSNSRVTSQTYLTSLTDALKALFGLSEFEGGFFDKVKNLTDVLFVWSSDSQKRLLFPLIAFLTPNVSCFDSLILVHSGYDNTYASMFIYTPLLLMFIPSMINAIKRKQVSVIIAFLGALLLLFTPFAYYCFSGFTSVAYARWYIFLTAISCLFVGIEYDKRSEMKIWSLDISFALIIFFYGYLLYKGEFLYNEGTSNIKEMDERIFYVYGEMIYILFMYIYLRRHFTKPDLTMNLRYFVALEAIVMCNITVLVGQGTKSYDSLYGGPNNFFEEMELAQQIKQEDDDYYRVFSTSADRDNNNFAMMLGTGGIGTFHSIYNYELDDFLSWSTVKYNNSWSMGVHEKRVNLDEFLGIKYYIVKDDDNNVPFGFSEYISTDDHVVYINDNYIPLGFAYDNIILSSYMSQYSTINNERAYLQGAILYEEDIISIFGEDYKNNEDFTFMNKSMLGSDIYSVSPSNDQIDVYRAKWDNGTFVGYEDPVAFSDGSGGSTSQLTWNSYLDVDLSSYNIGGEVATRGKCYVSVQARMGENLEITLYGEDEDGDEYVITKDRHMTQWYGRNDSDWKRQRGFYVDDKVTRMEVKVYETMNTYGNGTKQYLLRPNIRFEYEDTYLSDVNALKENQFSNIEIGVNDFSFDVDYDKDKFIVMQIPYDQGWKIEAYDENNNKVESPTIYKGQGGFISFLSKKGKYHYVLSYETPYFKEGANVMCLGFALVGAFYIANFLLSISKRRFEEEFEVR